MGVPLLPVPTPPGGFRWWSKFISACRLMTQKSFIILKIKLFDYFRWRSRILHFANLHILLTSYILELLQSGSTSFRRKLNRPRTIVPTFQDKTGNHRPHVSWICGQILLRLRPVELITKSLSLEFVNCWNELVVKITSLGMLFIFP